MPTDQHTAAGVTDAETVADWLMSRAATRMFAVRPGTSKAEAMRAAAAVSALTNAAAALRDGPLVNPSAAECEAPEFDLQATQSEAHGEGMDDAADFIFTELAEALGLTSFVPQDGSEEWKGDVRATLMHILWDAKVLDRETNERLAAGETMDGVPEGWQMVPARASMAMAKSAKTEHGGLSVWKADDIYRAMLAAAPPPPAPVNFGADGASVREKALREAAEAARKVRQKNEDQGFEDMAHGAHEAFEAILSLLATPADGGGK